MLLIFAIIVYIGGVSWNLKGYSTIGVILVFLIVCIAIVVYRK